MSGDWPLGTNFNMCQTFFFLALMAQITGLRPDKVYHRTINAHIYHDQLELVDLQLERTPFKTPKFHINPEIKTLEDVLSWVTLDDFSVTDYSYHPPIKFPFTV